MSVPPHFRLLKIALAGLMLTAARPGDDPAALVDKATALATAGKNAESLVVLDRALWYFDDPSPQRAAVEMLRASRLADLNRIEEAAIAAERAVAMAPDAILPQARALLAGIYQFKGRSSDAARELTTIFDTGGFEPTLLTPELVFGVRRALRKSDPDRSFDFDLAMLRSGWVVDDDPSALDHVATKSALGLIERGRLDEAGVVAGRIVTGDRVVAMLVDRRYQPLWSSLEVGAGPRLRTMQDRYVSAATAAAERAPGTPSLIAARIESLRFANRMDEAVAAGKQLGSTSALVARAGDRAVWALNAYGYALADAGRPDEAVSQFDALASLGDKAMPENIGPVINRLLVLAAIGRDEDVLSRAPQTEALAAKYASDFGRQYIRQAKVCALSHLARDIDARAELAQMNRNPDTNRPALLAALLCLEGITDAEPVFLAMLDDPDLRGDALISIQPSSVGGFETRRDDRMRRALAALAARPAVATRIAKVGRILPVDLRPD